MGRGHGDGANALQDAIAALPSSLTLRQRVDLHCTHQATIRCMSAGGEGASVCKNALDAHYLREVECFCNDCTSMMDRIIEGRDAIQESSEADRMSVQCLSVGLDACFTANSYNCVYAVDDLGFHDLPTHEQCEAEGHPTAGFSSEVSSGHRAPWSLIGAAVIALASSAAL